MRVQHYCLHCLHLCSSVHNKSAQWLKSSYLWNANKNDSLSEHLIFERMSNQRHGFSFIEEGLVIPEGWDWEKGKLKICWFVWGIEPRTPAWNARVLTTTPSRDCYVMKYVDYNKLSYEIKAPISPTLHKPWSTWLILGIKAYLLL